MKQVVLLFIAVTFSPLVLFAADAVPPVSHEEELNPYDPDIESKLEELDEVFAEPETDMGALFKGTNLGCRQTQCAVFLHVSKSRQLAELYLNGVYQSTFLVSTGSRSHPTPNFDRHPNGRIYDRYSSTKFPGGDYQGYGNMPFVVFIEGGFAVHGTPESNWKNLGKQASHGCVRVHPDNGRMFNRLVRQAGVLNTWITIEP